jgi:hypothetical protein
MATVPFVETPEVEMVNAALVAPAATVTLAGTLPTPVLALDNETTAPPMGAAPVSVTVPEVSAPLTTEAGLTVRAEMAMLLVTVNTVVATPL